MKTIADLKVGDTVWLVAHNDECDMSLATKICVVA